MAMEMAEVSNSVNFGSKPWRLTYPEKLKQRTDLIKTKQKNKTKKTRTDLMISRQVGKKWYRI